MHPTAESDSEVCITPQSQTPRCASYRGDKLHSVHPNAESSSAACITSWSRDKNFFLKLRSVHPTAMSDYAVCITSLSQTLRRASHHGVRLPGVHHTVKSNCTPQSQNRNICESLVGLKGTVERNPFRGEHILHERKDLKTIFLIC